MRARHPYDAQPLPIDTAHMPPINVQPTRHKSHGPCPHCGGLMQTAWGWVHVGEPTRAVYYVRWTAGHPEHGMTWHLAVGPWGPG